MSLDASNVQREKIVFELVKPFIPGFSVEPMEIDTPSIDDNAQPSTSKRKSIEPNDTIEQTPIAAAANQSATNKAKTKKNKKPKK